MALARIAPRQITGVDGSSRRKPIDMTLTVDVAERGRILLSWVIDRRRLRDRETPPEPADGGGGSATRRALRRRSDRLRPNRTAIGG
jgi:hypothetical protein